ncbi:MAG: hypothetical protein ACOZHQ_04700 [Thermodesulfobacteriota bacterium]
MPAQRRLLWRDIVAALMCSGLYFELAPGERLALVKQICRLHGPWPQGRAGR